MNFLYYKLAPVEGVDVEQTTGVGQDQPLMVISDSTSNAVLTIVIDGLNFAELAGGGIKFIYGADSSEFDH